jgi:hypothetical protein
MPQTNKAVEQARAEMCAIIEMLARWERDGRWIGGFENADLGHYDIGRRVLMSFEPSTVPIDDAELGNTRAPDSPAIGMGWRYLLGFKGMSGIEALAWMQRTGEDQGNGD